MLVEAFKKKHKLTSLSKKAQKNKLMLSEMVGYSSLNDDLILLGKKLKLNRVVLEDLITGWAKRKGLDYISLPLHISSGGDPLPDGFYIKVEPYTRLDTIKRTYKYIQFMLEDNLKNADAIELKNKKVVKRDKRQENLDFKIKLYCLVEKTLHQRKRDAKNEPSEEIRKDYESSLVAPAIELVSDELLKDPRRVNYCKDIYYTLQTYYELPSLSEFHELLISLS